MHSMYRASMYTIGTAHEICHIPVRNGTTGRANGILLQSPLQHQARVKGNEMDQISSMGRNLGRIRVVLRAEPRWYDMAISSVVTPRDFLTR